jgi:hypothetical protein
MCGRRDAVQLEPPEGGSGAEPGLGGLWSGGGGGGESHGGPPRRRARARRPLSACENRWAA